MTTDIRKGWTSASNAAADSFCAGRHIAQRGIPEKQSDDAEGGRAIHEALHDSDDSKLTVAQKDIYQSCKAIEAKLVAAVFGEKVAPVAFREQRYWCKFDVGTAGKTVALEHSGQADVVYRAGVRALVIDYKTLQGDVEDSPKNLQLRDLACLVKGNLIVVTEVATAIIQPLVTHDPEVCMYTEPDLKRSEQEMFNRIAASNMLEAKRVAGETQCKFCLAKKGCPEYSRWSGAMIPTGTLEPVVKDLIFRTAMQSWTPSQRAMVAGLLSPASKALDEIKEFLKDGLAKDANFIPGWSLTPGNKREVINDPQACFDRFAAIGGKLESFMGSVSISKTKLKEAINGVTGSVGRKLDEEVGKLIEGIIDVSHNSSSLKKVDK